MPRAVRPTSRHRLSRVIALIAAISLSLSMTPAAQAHQVDRVEKPASLSAAAVKAAISITAKAASVSYGKSSKMVVKLAGGAEPLGGTLTLTYGSRTVATVKNPGATNTIILAASVKAGTRTFGIVYSGDSNHDAAKARVTFTRTKAAVKLKVAASSPVFPGRGKVTVVLTGAGERPTGSVVVKSQGRAVAKATIVKGRAVVKLPARWVPGKRRLTATYGGSDNYLQKSIDVNQTVRKAASKVAIGAIPTVAHDEKPIVVVKVTSNAGTPTGKVSVRLKGRTIASGNLKNGKTTITLPVLKTAQHTIEVRYAGSRSTLVSSAEKKFNVKFELRGKTTFSNGLYKVNSDVRPGLYRVQIPVGQDCEWAKSDSQGNSPEGWRARVYGLMRILITDKYVSTRGCGTWKLVSQTPDLPFKNGSIPGTGTFIIGKDIAPGVYQQQKAGCYAALMSDLTGHAADVTEAEVSTGELYANITKENFAFESLECGTWTKIG